VDSLIGQTLDGRYLIEARIGEGAMGAVYKARHIAMAQPVAIKFLLTDRVNEPGMVERFIREARQTFKIDHPNCVRVTDFSAMDDGTLYIVMDYLDGRTVSKEIAVDGPIASARVRHIAAQAADALHHAHGLGLVHRDLKPDNMMLLQRGSDYDFTKIFDFGLAKLFDEGMALTGLSMSPLTKDGIVFGTPSYMAPEQALGGTLGPAADIYTLGVCCYEMLTAEVPFEGDTFTTVLSMHVTAVPRRPSEIRPDLDIDPQLESLVMSCLAKEESKRPTAPELAKALRGGSQELPPTSSQGLASSETVLLDNMDLPPRTTARVTASPMPGKGRRRRLVPFLLTIPLLAILLVWGLGGDDEEGESTPEESPKATALVPPDAAPARLPTQTMPDAGAPIDAAPTDARAAPKDKPARNPHLAAAESAYRAKNPIKQLAEAHAALKAQPRNRRANFLAGDALLKGGDKVRACKFFKRSSKKHYRANGCEN
jgi:serine/threonine-protein kinase